MSDISSSSAAFLVEAMLSRVERMRTPVSCRSLFSDDYAGGNGASGSLPRPSLAALQIMTEKSVKWYPIHACLLFPPPTNILHVVCRPTCLAWGSISHQYMAIFVGHVDTDKARHHHPPSLTPPRTYSESIVKRSGIIRS